VDHPFIDDLLDGIVKICGEEICKIKVAAN